MISGKNQFIKNFKKLSSNSCSSINNNLTTNNYNTYTNKKLKEKNNNIIDKKKQLNDLYSIEKKDLTVTNNVKFYQNYNNSITSEKLKECLKLYHKINLTYFPAIKTSNKGKLPMKNMKWSILKCPVVHPKNAFYVRQNW